MVVEKVSTYDQYLESFGDAQFCTVIKIFCNKFTFLVVCYMNLRQDPFHNSS